MKPCPVSSRGKNVISHYDTSNPIDYFENNLGYHGWVLRLIDCGLIYAVLEKPDGLVINSALPFETARQGIEWIITMMCWYEDNKAA